MKHPNELDQQLENARTLQQSYNAIAAAAEAYNVGKQELSAAITAKGVETSPTETYPQMAEKVRDIQQTTTTIDGGDMYSAQIFGDGALWDLYQVLTQMKSRFMGTDQYKALIVCEYYKGYDSLQLQGADAYYTCDGDYYDMSSPLHTWHDSDNGKMNRWVCFLYATEGARLDITNTDISPRSMYIGGHIGTIEYFVNGRLTELVCGVEETDVLDNFKNNGYTQNFLFKAIIRNVIVDKGIVINNSGFVDITMNNSINNNRPSLVTNAKYINIALKNTLYIEAANYFFVEIQSAEILKITGGITQSSKDYGSVVYCTSASAPTILKTLTLPGYIGGGEIVRRTAAGSYFNKLIDVEVGACVSSFSFKYWMPDYLSDADKKAELIDNIKNHILARVSDQTGLSRLTFTVSTNMFNSISGEIITWNDEEMTLADAFLAKNWLLAGV